MYMRLVHAESRVAVLHQLIRENPFGILTTGIPSNTHAFLQSSHIPFVLDVQDDVGEADLGVLRGHIARQNPQSKSIVESLSPADGASTYSVLEQEVLVLFTAAANHYITPKFYTQTKPSTGKVVPTWNYAGAQVYGKAKIFFDSRSEETREFLSTQLHDLSQLCEGSIMGYTGKDGRPDPWTLAEAPASYTSLLMKNIIGIEIQVEKLEGKFKMSQELSKGDVEGVLCGLEGLKTDAARAVADIVKDRDMAKISVP